MTGTLWVRQRKTLIKNVRDTLWYKIRLEYEAKEIFKHIERQRKSYVYKQIKDYHKSVRDTWLKVKRDKVEL